MKNKMGKFLVVVGTFALLVGFGNNVFEAEASKVDVPFTAGPKVDVPFSINPKI